MIGRISSDCLKEGHACLLFASRDSAEACRDFLLSENREENKCEPTEVGIKAFDFRMRLWATTFPAPKMLAAVAFWQDPGTGISSRIARDCLDHYEERDEVECAEGSADGLSMVSEAFAITQKRIANLLNRAPVTKHPSTVSPQDVYLYPTGMAAIYQLQQYLQRSASRPGTTVLFGYAFHSTPHVMKWYSSTFKWFGKGNDDEVKQLEEFCASENEAGRLVQSLWVEFPSNPNIRTPDLQRIRALADRYGFCLIVDDTISSFCNVDLLGAADAVVTSLTKSFSGYSDVMGGSVVLNPNSKQYQRLTEILKVNFVNEVYSGDVEALEKNSRDYFERAKRLNDNALALAQYLNSLIHDPSSAVYGVAYPSVGPGAEYYKQFMRPETSDFKPGYGCLLSIELDSIESTVAFYDNLTVHQGPHLGANLTLALPYVKAIGGKEEIHFMIESGMNERMIRISTGLEDTDELVQTFKRAVEAADAVKAKDPLDKYVNPINGTSQI